MGAGQGHDDLWTAHLIMGLKIAIIGSRGYPYVYSGYETFVKELAERLAQKGFDVTVYNHRGLFKDRPKTVNGIHVVYIPTIESKISSQFIHSFLSICHACWTKYDLLLVVNAANGPFGLVAKIFRQKTAINVDGLEWLRPKWRGLGSRYFYWAAKLATRWYDVVIADSLEMQKIYKAEFGCDSTFIAYGANLKYPTTPRCLAKWNLEKDQYYLIVGRLIPDNNVGLMVQEYTKARSERKLVVVGDMPYRDSYAQNIKAIQDPRLVFTGYIRDKEELTQLYHYCFVYLHGHEYGGTNPTLLEALANGCAILALDTVFSREMLKDGLYGIFFSKEAGGLKQAIEAIEKSPELRDRLRQQSRNRIAENYTWEKITEQYIQFIGNVVKAR